MAQIRLGDLLVKARVINETQLKAALAEQQKWGGRLGEILVRMSFVTEDMLVKALSKQLSIVAVDLDAIQTVAPHVKNKVPPEVAKDLGAVPLQLRDDGKSLIVAMVEPQNLKHLDTLRSITRCRIMPQVAGRSAIARAFTRFYDGAEFEPTAGASGATGKFVDAAGKTIVKSTDEVKPLPRMTVPPLPKTEPMPVASITGSMPAAMSPGEILRGVEEAQRREVAALKALVETLIEKGVFTRDEYLAKVKR